jgi:hypothetical protein
MSETKKDRQLDPQEIREATAGLIKMLARHEANISALQKREAEEKMSKIKGPLRKDEAAAQPGAGPPPKAPPAPKLPKQPLAKTGPTINGPQNIAARVASKKVPTPAGAVNNEMKNFQSLVAKPAATPAAKVNSEMKNFQPIVSNPLGPAAGVIPTPNVGTPDPNTEKKFGTKTAAVMPAKK